MLRFSALVLSGVGGSVSISNGLIITVKMSSLSLSQSTNDKITAFLKGRGKVSIILIILINNDVIIFGKNYNCKMSFFSHSDPAYFDTRLNLEEIPESSSHGIITKMDKTILE